MNEKSQLSRQVCLFGISHPPLASLCECYHRSLAVSSTTISYPVYVVILGVGVGFKPHWMFQIYKCVIIGHEEFTSCSSVMYSYLFPLQNVLYRQVGNLSFWTVSCTIFLPYVGKATAVN